MELILREDVEKLGSRGQVVKVADGYARNFLLPKRLAVAATESNKKIVDQERQAHLRREAKEEADAQGLAAMLSGVSLTISRKAGEDEHLFGSVTVKDVADQLEALKYTIDRKKIAMEPVKQLGEHKVSIKLHKNVSVDLPLRVVKED